ncbi:MAG: phosphate/phosphite/phosphonate ABC transporter substrate-binding protein [Desulfobulbaceae bacterium]|nr:MAG: phosphate/phosphite/phosphonate ABC transporter substrate-binding protein [Desulfobulbaceae bacterium]
MATLLCLALLLLLSQAGCDRNDTTEEPVIRLDKLVPLPESSPAVASDSLRVAVAAIISPQGTIQSYQPFIHYLEKKTGRNIVLVQRKTYQEVNDMLARGVVEVAFVCTGAYWEGRRAGSMDLLVVPQVNGKLTYQSLLIAPHHSRATGMEGLRDKVFAFTDPLSNSGYMYPLSVLHKAGESPETFFSRTIFTYSHDRSIVSVIEGIADGAAVDSIIYESLIQKDPEIGKLSKIIYRSPEFGIPPVVVPKHIKPETAALLKELFLDAHTDPDGSKALAEIGVERFVEADEAMYDPYSLDKE